MNDQLTVYVKGYPVTFTTTLTWPDAINILRELAKTNNFAASLLEREDKNLHMSSSQVCWVYKLAEDARAKATSEPAPAPVTYEADNILNSMMSALERGIKKPVLRLNYQNQEVKIKYVRTSEKCWITLDSELVGMIDCFKSEMKVFANKLSDADSFTQFLVNANNNVREAIESYGRITSHCGCCGLPLTNKKSIELGIGPICIEKYGLMAMI